MKILPKFLLCASLLPLLSQAADVIPPYTTAEQLAGWTARREAAAIKEKEGTDKKAEAEAIYLTDEKACFAKFFVNACRDEVAQVRVQRVRAARHIINQAKAEQRAVNTEELAAKDAYRLREVAAAEADAKANAATTIEDRAKHQKEANAYYPKKLEKAEEGMARKALQADEHQAKVDKHQQKVQAAEEKHGNRN